MKKRFISKKKLNLRFNASSIIILVLFLICYSLSLFFNNNINSEIVTKLILEDDNIDLKINKDNILKYAFGYIPVEKDESIPTISLVEEKDNEPIIYIYNTHQSEKYLSKDNDYDVGIYMASFMLQEKLNRLGIYSIVEKTNITEILHMNNWSYSSSYKVSRMLMEEAKKNNPSLKIFIDLHRDSSKREKTITTINNKEYARVLFIVGLENNNYEENLIVTEKINSMIKSIDESLSRGIYKKSGEGVNGVYNQDFDKNTILIEVGGQYNYIEEVENTLDVLAEIISTYVKENL